MKTSTFCLIAISVVLQSCFLFESDEMPAMDSRVVSYKMIGDGSEQLRPEYRERGGFVLGRDTLKSWFPHIFNDEQMEFRCNYFAIYFVHSDFRYMILSQDMVLYSVQPKYNKCAETTDMKYASMLVCDDAEEGNLKDKIKLDATRSYTDPNWDCRKERGVFF
ncbi:MAG: hypothetical protein LBU89_01380 [Fibromonadaceae bacterium]|jgi:hypothetical protein|nr:hypothetical protein [Fibromonadaceae bacterium]